MHPDERDPDMAAATGILIALVISVGGCAGLYAIATWGGDAAHYALWATATMVETMR